MQEAVKSYLYHRNQQNMCAVDSCADAAEFHGLRIDEFSRYLIDSGTVIGRDADKLAILASDVSAMRAAMI